MSLLCALLTVKLGSISNNMNGVTMHLKTRNAGTAFHALVLGIHEGTIPTEVRASRYGETCTIPEPVIITYQKPTEKILFNPYRDVNHPFQLYEALWMLAARRDVAPLAYYNPRMKEFSDDGDIFNAAYGYRWRRANGESGIGMEKVRDKQGEVTGYGHFVETRKVDQLKVIIDHLKRKPESRRAVLHISEVENDLLKMDTTKDQACNISVCFSVELGPCLACDGGKLLSIAPCSKCGGLPHDQPHSLNMTVFNRSNDLIWGCLGANVVHFAFLQEFVAAHLGLKVGVYNQISNNIHCYTKTWKPLEWLKDYEQGGTQSHKWYDSQVHMVPLVKDPATFNREVMLFAEQGWGGRDISLCWEEPFLSTVALPMVLAFYHHKQREYAKALNFCSAIAADDWRVASEAWIRKRKERYENTKLS